MQKNLSKINTRIYNRNNNFTIEHNRMIFKVKKMSVKDLIPSKTIFQKWWKNKEVPK